MKKAFSSVLFSTLAFSLTTDGLNGAHEDKNLCTVTTHPFSADVRHVEGGGVGYKYGYTSADLMLGLKSPRTYSFIDLRGHVFDDGKWAANGGLGWRYLFTHRIFGINAYYDYREASHHGNYSAVGVGLESLGKIWDFRANGYFPVGDKTSPWYDKSYSAFVGNTLIVRRKQQFSMMGVNAEIGAHLGKISKVRFYSAIGPYYYEGQGHNTYGGQFRFSIAYSEYVKGELIASYDSIFRSNYQGQLSFRIPFGKSSSNKKSGTRCSTFSTLQNSLTQPVQRNEIIVLDSRHKKLSIPGMGVIPLLFIVPRINHSLGTIEPPFPTLAQDLSSAMDSTSLLPIDAQIPSEDASTTSRNNASTKLDDVKDTYTMPPIEPFDYWDVEYW